MGFLLVNIVHTVARILFLVILVDIVLSYFMSPYHPVRMTLDKIVEPLLRPVRRLIPPIQGIDLSPIVLIILIQIIEYLLVAVFIRL